MKHQKVISTIDYFPCQTPNQIQKKKLTKLPQWKRNHYVIIDYDNNNVHNQQYLKLSMVVNNVHLE